MIIYKFSKRSKSSISREIKRNSDQYGYDSKLADRKYRKRQYHKHMFHTFRYQEFNELFLKWYDKDFMEFKLHIIKLFVYMPILNILVTAKHLIESKIIDESLKEMIDYVNIIKKVVKEVLEFSQNSIIK